MRSDPSPVRDARETTYEEMQQQFRSSKEISEEAFWELEPHIERLEAQWCRELRERETEMLGGQSRAAAREYAHQDAEADVLFAEADRLDDLAGLPDGYRQEITAGRAERIRAQLGADLVIGDADQLAAVPGLQRAERDAEIDRLAERYPEPGEAANYYRPAYGRYEPDWIPPSADLSPTAWDPYLADHGYETHPARFRMPEVREDGAEPDDANYRAQGEYDEALRDNGTPGYGAYASPGCTCAYGHPDRLTAGQQAAAEPEWVDAARCIPGQERDETEMAGERLSEHAARAEDAWRRERRATAREHLAQLAHDEQGLGWARQDAKMAREARESATRGAYMAAADMQRSALGPELDDAGGRSLLPRVLETSPATLAPVAVTLPDGTPHADPFLAGRGWQAQGGVYVRQAQVQAEAV